MQKLKKLVFFFVVSIFGLSLFACSKQKNVRFKIDDSWRTPGYKQGDFGNIHKLDVNGYAIEDNSIPNSRKLPYFSYEQKDRYGVRQKGIITNFYVETNDYNPLNAMRYEIGDTGVPYCDIVTCFAANIVNGSGTKPTMHFNGGIKVILENVDKIVKPLQEKGIKVVMDFLPHHDGWGYYNMRGADLEHFLDQVAEFFDKYGFDGIDIDEEYAEYGAHGPRPPRNSNAPTEFVKRFRDRFPNKLLTVFNYAIDFNATEVKGKIDFAYNNYGQGTSVPAWCDRRNVSNYSIEANAGVWYDTTKYSAESMLNKGAGVQMYFNTKFDTNLAFGFSGACEVLYGLPCRDMGVYIEPLLKQ